MGGYMRSNILICLLALTVAVVTQKVLQVERMVSEVEQMVIENEVTAFGNGAYVDRALNWNYVQIQQMKKGK
jgi:hypothetical protein